MAIPSKFKVFIGFSEVAGYYKNLFEGLRQIGFDCGYLNKNSNKFNYSRPQGNDRIFELMMFFNQAFDGRLVRYLLFPIYAILHILAFIRIVQNYNVIIIHNGSTLMRGWDVPIYRKLGLKVIVVSLGSDSRPPIMNGALIDDLGSSDISLETLVKETIKVRARVKKYEDSSDVFISSSSYGHFNQKRIVNLIPLGFPAHQNSHVVDSLEPYSRNRPIKILHAPTRSRSKGSEQILAVLRSLSGRYPLEIDLLEGVTNQEVLARIRESDVIIDQMYSDMPSPGFASEAVGMGKLVFVCGYYANYIRNDVPKALLPATFFITPESLSEELEKVFKHLLEKGIYVRQGQSYSTSSVARRFEALFSGSLPDEYWCEPADIKYLEGYGRPIKSLIDYEKLSDYDYHFLTGLMR